MLAVAACTTPVRGTRAGPAPTVPAPTCRQSTPLHESSAGSEARAASTAGGLQAWALVQAPVPIHVGDDVKVVWRVTGEGDLSLTLREPGGLPRALQWGPEAHTESNYERPGEEWGSGYTFDGAGCWVLGVARGAGTAIVVLDVHE